MQIISQMFRIIIMLLLFITQIDSQACSFWPVSFCKSIDYYPNSITIYGEVLSLDEDGIDFLIFEKLNGDELKDTVRVWDGTDFDCNGWHSMAAADIGGVNDSLVLQLSMITETANTWDVLGDYRRPSPYGDVPKLRIENGIVTGMIQGDYFEPDYLSSLDYEAFKDHLMNDQDCSVSVAIEDLQDKSDLKLNNPFANSLQINASAMINKGNITLYSLNGQALLTEEINHQNTIEIQTSNLQSGIYLVAINAEGKLPEVFKVIKL